MKSLLVTDFMILQACDAYDLHHEEGKRAEYFGMEAALKAALETTHPPAQASQVETPQEGHCIRVLSCDGEWEGEALWEAGEGCYVTRVPVQSTAETVAQGEAVAFKQPAAVRSSAAFLLERLEHAPCDNSGVSCCIRCSAVAMSRWAIEALGSSQTAPSPDASR